MEFDFNGKKVGENNKVFIIAELSANHNQNYDIAVKTIKAMKEAGADAVKLQTYTADTLTLDCDNDYFKINQGTLWDGQTFHELYKQAYTPWDWQPKLKKLADELGLVFFSSAFDKTAIDFLDDMNVPMHKIASFEITDIPLIKHAASKGKPLIISTGIATSEDIEKAVEACKEVGNDKIILLKCTSAYPTPYEEANLATIKDLEERFGVVAGLSDHTLGISAPVASVALGAKLIEKHFILDKKLGGPDVEFSLNPKEFKQMVDSVREAEKAIGKVNYELTEKMKKGKEFARSLFVSKDVKEGEVFSEENVRSVRPWFGLHPENFDKVIGKKARKDIKMGTPLSWELIDDGKE
ncbi:pseudaminic acid synthase [Candidatus Pacearchaeota archaeon]|nr:pseudaminic acid synthase [Candidatus Pacearchaeota archaeon]|tara:strand:- start:5520 stop:6578 length:1059 start_codon:yes stop_codon:yes gene_type:complete